MMLPKSERCTGCGSCAAICPKNCIRMIPDDEGFLYPQIDGSQCVGCKKCETACPVLQVPKASESVQAYATQNMDRLIRQQSSSGGVFTALAKQVIQKGGVVCAAVYNDQFEVEHRIADTEEELAPMRGAKYSQSHAGHLFRQLKELLESGKPVMFTGTPCQCAGLKAYLGKEYEQLLLVDMVCHGVPAPSVWKAYVRCRRELDANGAELSSINLRDKSTGWSRYAYSVKFQYADGSAYCIPQSRDPYMRGFVGDLYLRPSCSVCSFKGINRCSDLTLGDCWGVWDSHPDFDDNQGTSLLFIQSEKGQKLWKCIQSDFRTVALTAEQAVLHNPSAMSASDAHPRRAELFSRLREGEPVAPLIWDLLMPKAERQSLIKRILRKIVSIFR